MQLSSNVFEAGLVYALVSSLEVELKVNGYVGVNFDLLRALQLEVV